MDLNDIISMGAGDYYEADDDPGLGGPFDVLRSLAAAAGKQVPWLPRGFQPRPAPRAAVLPRGLQQLPGVRPLMVANPPQGNMAAQLAQLLQNASAIPGVRSAPGGRTETMGGTPSFFTFGPLTPQVATLQFLPFKPVKPTRLIISVTIIGAPGADVLLSAANIGDRNQLAGAGGVPVGAFAANATVSRINWDIILPSVPLNLLFSTTATPAAATSITISPALYVLTMS